MKNEKNEKTVSLLNGLIEINNDRITGYEKAAKETDEEDLKSLFNELADNSRQYRASLIADVVSHGGTPAEGNTTAGKFYHAWMDVKAAFGGKDPKAILSSCEFGEDAALEAYDEALKSDSLTVNARETISKQRTSLKQSHDKIKAMRDTVKQMH